MRILATTFLLVCIVGAGVNYLIDPYSLFGSRRLPGFNELKPAAAERGRVTKPYMASRAKPKVVIGGNSRPEMGLNPQSTCWEDTDRPVFNMGIPGAGVYMQTRYVQHAVESGRAQRVLLSVDFSDFLVDASQPTGNIDWDQLGKPFEGRLNLDAKASGRAPVTLQHAEDILSGLFSLVALGDSIVTLTSQHDKNAATRHEDGYNPALDYRPIIRNEGQAVLFSQKNQESRKLLQQDNLGILDAHGGQTVPLLALRRFLDWAGTRGVEVVLFINPYHSDYLVQIQMAGKWSLLEDWKRQLASIATEHDVPLWDFNAFDQYSTESPPLPKDRHTELNWFWEPAHYRHQLGDLMLASMLNRQCGNGASPKRIGIEVTQPTLQRHLDAISSDLHEFIEAHPQVIKRLSGRGYGFR